MSFVLELKKENFKFSASHFTIFGPDHAERLHGHNYYVTVKLYIRDVQTSTGMTVEFNEIKSVIKTFTERLDERVLIPKFSPYLILTELPSSASHLADQHVAPRDSETASAHPDSKNESASGGHLQVRYGHKIYQFPISDIFMLPATNITSEELARFSADEIVTAIQQEWPQRPIESIEIGIEETRGQIAFYQRQV
jgi:6-pyruvoyltetrahydropterin/6-carboxytetrahydropterin synthase